MIQLKARDGHILYTAETATDVRTALQEAVLRSADLRSADLRGADLRSADLRSADLRGADLRSADLRGADLHGADLRSADLRSADLRSADLRSADLRGADLHGADLHGANLHGANLRSADLRSADLRSADLRGADLHGADLHGANLHGANLRSADLRGANGVIPERTHPLHMLFDQVGKIRAYKLVTAEGRSPIQRAGTLLYEHGKTVEVRIADTDPARECAAGVNVATLDWCLANHRPGQRILIVEFKKDDIAAIPNTTDGKFRVFRCKVVGEKDLSTLGVA